MGVIGLGVLSRTTPAKTNNNTKDNVHVPAGRQPATALLASIPGVRESAVHSNAHAFWHFAFAKRNTFIVLLLQPCIYGIHWNISQQYIIMHCCLLLICFVQRLNVESGIIIGNSPQFWHSVSKICLWDWTHWVQRTKLNVVCCKLKTCTFTSCRFA